MIKLICPVQTYAWGKRGSNSLVARLKKSSNDKVFDIEECGSYAELWMGTHPSGPATDSDGNTLSQILRTHPQLVGIVPSDYPQDDLPFLFKVLSVETALSIQAHPDKTLAAHLHKLQPEHYKDSNHKPEMVIALTDFECLCGFRSMEEIKHHIAEYPEFTQLIGIDNISDVCEDGEYLKRIFNLYMNASVSVSNDCQYKLKSRLTSKSDKTALDDLLLRLMAQYPSDNGVFAPILMNFIKLQKDESFYIGANELHAYISGNCIECMALSDNVVRTAVYSHFISLHKNFRMGLPQFITPENITNYSKIYRPPFSDCPEFAVEAISLEVGEKSLRSLKCASILLIMESGNAYCFAENENPTHFNRGNTFFIGANVQVRVVVEEGKFIAFRAHSNVDA